MIKQIAGAAVYGTIAAYAAIQLVPILEQLFVPNMQAHQAAQLDHAEQISIAYGRPATGDAAWVSEYTQPRVPVALASGDLNRLAEAVKKEGAE